MNRLAGETSPYLLQHAGNPVDWYPWGAEALARAASGDRPIFLSIGYAACHWCHVMAHESFEDERTAALLNAGFVPIKVDREERPDLDAIYMAAVQAMTHGGGWPMSVFLTPDGRPFYGGTYFPAEPRFGMPSFRQVLESVATAWRERRNEVEQAATDLADALRRQQAGVVAPAPVSAEAPPGAPEGGSAAIGGEAGPGDALASAGLSLPAHAPGLDRLVLDGAIEAIVGTFDAAHGGWGGAPRFPQPSVIELLLRRYRSRGDERALGVARRALDAMANGGIHDQLGGGFHRYATDPNWLVPHFEKMLYDNAQLARVYLHAFQLTGEARYETVARATLDYLARELVTPEGMLASSQDADTGGVEGATYVWTRDEIAAALANGPTEADDRPPVHAPDFAASVTGQSDDSPPPDETIPLRSPSAQLDELFATAYGVRERGNWEGRTILSRVRSDAEAGLLHGLSAEEAGARLARARAALVELRQARPQPGRDDKAIAAWNGLALAAFADAIPVLDRAADRAVAGRVAEAVLRHLRGPDGRLGRSFRDGRRSGAATLDDYASLAEGLLSLYEATFEERWLDASRELAAVVVAHFAYPGGGWFDTPDDGERLLLRPRELQDGPTPSGGAAATLVLLRLAELTGEGRQRTQAERALQLVQPLAARYPLAFAGWLLGLDFALGPVEQVAIAADPARADARALLAVARRGFQPYRILAAGDPSTSSVELLQARFSRDGRATGFVCREFACRWPVTEPEALAAQLS